MKNKKKQQRLLAAPHGSAASVEPLMPYSDWCVLGPEKAAEYLAKRRGYSAEC